MVFHTPGKERRELTTSDEPMTMIIRQDKKVMWTLMPEANAYMEMSIEESQDKTDFSAYQIDQTTVGEEDINGVRTTKSKVIMTNKDGSKLGGFWWTTKEGIPLKMDMISVKGKTKENLPVPIFFMEALLTRLTKTKSFAIEWKPFELGLAPQPTLRREREYLKRVWRVSVSIFWPRV